jgi:hypothetical protein
MSIKHMLPTSTTFNNLLFTIYILSCRQRSEKMATKNFTIYNVSLNHRANACSCLIQDNCIIMRNCIWYRLYYNYIIITILFYLIQATTIRIRLRAESQTGSKEFGTRSGSEAEFLQREFARGVKFSPRGEICSHRKSSPLEGKFTPSWELFPYRGISP